MGLELLDQSSSSVGTLTTVTGKVRIDHLAAASGETYTVRLTGTNNDVDLKICNLVQKTGSTVDVFGSASVDTFTLDLETNAFTINGIAYATEA